MTVLALLVSALGLALHRWSRTGIEAGAHDRRAWATTLGPIVAVIGALAALAGVIGR